MSERKDVRQDAIFQWNMTVEEGETYKLAIFYEKEFVKIFKENIDGQTYRRNSVPKRGDPRKSYIFRHCWKLRRETRGLLKLEEYPLYIKANLMILKLYDAHVTPDNICGDKAWIRWRVWKRRYDQKVADLAAAPPPPSVATTDPKIIREIDRTKKFLFERCDGQPTLEKLRSFVENGFLKMWVMTGKVSQFYVALSPFLQKICDLNELAQNCGFDLNLINGLTTEQVRNYFIHEFGHEQLT